MATKITQKQLVRTGNAMRRARSAKGWTLSELADAMGISKGSLSKYENGLMQASGDKIALFEDTLGLAKGTVSVLDGTADSDTIWMLLHNTDPDGYDHLSALAERMVLTTNDD